MRSTFWSWDVEKVHAREAYFEVKCVKTVGFGALLDHYGTTRVSRNTFAPRKALPLQEASVKSRPDPENRAKSSLQKGCPTHMANIKKTVKHPAVFFVLSGGWVPSNPDHLVEDGQHGPAIQKRYLSFPIGNMWGLGCFSIFGLLFSCPLFLWNCSNLGLRSLLMPRLSEKPSYKMEGPWGAKREHFDTKSGPKMFRGETTNAMQVAWGRLQNDMPNFKAYRMLQFHNGMKIIILGAISCSVPG